MRADSVRTVPDGLTVESGERTLRVEAVTDAIVRVVYTGDEVASPEESAMIASPPDGSVDPTVHREADTLTLATDSLSLDIGRTTGAFTWYGPDGERLVREPDGGGKEIHEVSPSELAVGEDVASPESSLDRTAYETKLEFDFSEDEAVYGLGQHEEGIGNYRGHTQDLYQTCTKVAMPAIVSTRGYGVLWDSHSLATFHDDQHGSYFWTECDRQMEFYFVVGPELDDVVGSFRDLLGTSPLFPKWAYGYLQSRERYDSQAEMVSVVQEYRDREVPLDCIVQDWRYWPDDDATEHSPLEHPEHADWGQWGQKSFDPERFPDPSRMIADVHEMDARYMISIWPNMLAGENRREMEAAGYLIDEENRTTSPKNEQGFTDVFQPGARGRYWQQAKEGLWDHGVDAWWCDSPEPYHADWNRPNKPQPFERTRLNADTLKTTIDPAYINAYSLFHSRGMYEGQRGETSEKRVVNLTRSASPGQHRYGTITWSGDIEATWDRLEKQIADGLNFTATGNPKWTLDIGGFFAGDDPESWFVSGDYPDGVEDMGYRELYVRWFQLGAFLPMFRSHGTHTPREVWQFGEPGERFYDTLVAFDELRYRLLPYVYSLAGQETHRDYTMFRHLAFDFREDHRVFDVADQFMFGPSLMVCPVTDPMYYRPGSEPLPDRAEAREVYLPAGTDWYDFWTGQRHDGGQHVLADAPLEKVPLFVPVGSILPMGPVVQHTGAATNEPWQVRVYPGGDAAFDVYEDAGDGYDYEDGDYAWTPLRWDQASGTFSLGDREGSFPELAAERDVHVVRVGEGRGVGHDPVEDPMTATYDGEETTLFGE